jgi:hypothetical protein
MSGQPAVPYQYPALTSMHGRTFRPGWDQILYLKSLTLVPYFCDHSPP